MKGLIVESLFFIDLFKMKLPIKDIQGLKRRLCISEELRTHLQKELDNYFEENKEVIENYYRLKSAIEELDNRIHLQYKFTILNSKSSGKILNAKLRLPFKVETKGKKRVSYLNVHIGKLSNYEQGISDPKAFTDAEEKIKMYLDKKFPFIILIADNQPITIGYCNGEKEF